MFSMTKAFVAIQTSAQSVPSTPSWFEEITLIAHYLNHLGVLSALAEGVRFARSRFGQYDTLDFVAVLLGYAISGERTLEAFYERVRRHAECCVQVEFSKEGRREDNKGIEDSRYIFASKQGEDYTCTQEAYHISQ